MFLGIDLGLGGVKATVVTGEGLVAGEASCPVRTFTPLPGRAEQDPAEWQAAMKTALESLAAQVALGRLEGISFSAGTHSTVLLDGKGAVLRPSILWADQRAGAEAAELNAKMQERLIEIGHNRAAATWSVAPLWWVRRNEPEIAARVRKVAFVKDWLRALLTGDSLTDRIDAQGSLMLDMQRLDWSEEICNAIGWPVDSLPRVVNPTDRAGAVTPEAAATYGLRAGTPVYVGTCDTAAEVWGAGAVSAGDTVIKLASAGVVNVIAAAPTKRPDAPSKGYVVPGLFYALGAINSCATGHKWLAEMLLGDGERDFSDLDQQAQAVAPGSEGLMFHPYLMGERAPYWDPALRASFIGLTIRHGRGHMVRAFYEGVAMALRDAAQPLRDAGLQIGPAALIGGGARSDLWAQIIADVFDRPIRRPLHGDASYGTALLAAVGAGAFADEADAARRCVRFGPEIRPDPAGVALYDKRFERYRCVKTLLTEINHEISSDLQP